MDGSSDLVYPSMGVPLRNPRPLPLVVGLFTDRAQDTCNQQSRTNNQNSKPKVGDTVLPTA